MIVGLDGFESSVEFEIDYALEDLQKEKNLEFIKRKYNIDDIKQSLLNYIFKIRDFNIENFYFENEYIFVHYRTLDSYFTNKFRNYNQYKLKLIAQNE